MRLLIPLVLAAVASPVWAGSKSTFRIMDASVKDDALTLKIAYCQVGSACKVEFFAHDKPPRHRDPQFGPAHLPRVADGLSIGTVNMPLGSDSLNLNVSLKDLREKAKVVPGQTLHLGAKWLGISHEWGVQAAGWSKFNAGTSIKVPTGVKNSRLRVRVPPRRPLWRGNAHRRR